MRIAVFASIELCRAGLEEALAHTAPVADVTAAEFVPRCENGPSNLALPDGDAGPTALRTARRGMVAHPRVLRGQYARFVQSGPDPLSNT